MHVRVGGFKVKGNSPPGPASTRPHCFSLLIFAGVAPVGSRPSAFSCGGGRRGGGGAAVVLAMGAGQEASRGESSTALVGQILLATFDFDVFAAMMESMERGRRDASVRK